MSAPEEEGLALVCQTVAESLVLDPAEVGPDDRLIPDLGADSLDLVDLMFRFEKRFGVKVLEEELELVGHLDTASPEVLQDGAFTDEVLDRVRIWLPEVDDRPAGTGLTPGQLFQRITCRALWRLIKARRPS